MSIKGYEFSHLNQEQLDRIKKLEGEINQDADSEVILLAFNHQ
ncbi:hypothetical protein JCM16358_11450 [Halanaerocella petrolearia]